VASVEIPTMSSFICCMCKETRVYCCKTCSLSVVTVVRPLKLNKGASYELVTMFCDCDGSYECTINDYPSTVELHLGVVHSTTPKILPTLI
jgi:hypothetical protein